MKEAQGGINYGLSSTDDCEGPDLCTGKPSTGYFCQGGAELPNDAWTYLAGTYNGSTYSFYINGQLASSATGNIPLGTSTKPLRIGGDSISGDFFVGVIDELRIYDHALSSTELQADMQTPVNDTGPDTTPPTVSLTSPSNGIRLTGQVELQANASDDVRVDDVKFFVDGTLVGGDDWPPFVAHWDALQAASGVTYLDRDGDR